MEWKAAKPANRTEFEPAPGGRRGDAAEHVVAADHVGDPVLTDQPGRRFTVELCDAHDMRPACNRGHRRGIAERSAERHRPKQHRIRRIRSDMAGDIIGVPGNGLLIVQDQFRTAGGARRGERQTGRRPSRLLRPRIGRGAVERQHRQAGELRHAGSRLQPEHAAQRGAIFRRQRGENRREVDRRESPLRHQSDGARPAQDVTDFSQPKARVDVDGKRAEPRAGEDRGEVSRAIRQPQRHPSARADTAGAQRRRHPQHAVLESAPVQRARGVGHRRRRRVRPGPRQQRAERARIVRSIGCPHAQLRQPASQPAGG